MPNTNVVQSRARRLDGCELVEMDRDLLALQNASRNLGCRIQANTAVTESFRQFNLVQPGSPPLNSNVNAA